MVGAPRSLPCQSVASRGVSCSSRRQTYACRLSSLANTNDQWSTLGQLVVQQPRGLEVGVPFGSLNERGIERWPCPCQCSFTRDSLYLEVLRAKALVTARVWAGGIDGRLPERGSGTQVDLVKYDAVAQATSAAIDGVPPRPISARSIAELRFTTLRGFCCFYSVGAFAYAATNSRWFHCRGILSMSVAGPSPRWTMRTECMQGSHVRAVPDGAVLGARGSSRLCLAMSTAGKISTLAPRIGQAMRAQPLHCVTRPRNQVVA